MYIYIIIIRQENTDNVIYSKWSHIPFNVDLDNNGHHKMCCHTIQQTLFAEQNIIEVLDNICAHLKVSLLIVF